MYLMVVGETIEVFIFGITGTIQQDLVSMFDNGSSSSDDSTSESTVVVIRVDLCFLKTIEYAGLLNTFQGFHYPCCNFG